MSMLLNALRQADYELSCEEVEAQARPYQREDARRALNILLDYRAVLLAHEPGLGKTLIALMIKQRLRALRVLVVCPAVARLVWEQEILTWLPWLKSRLHVIHPGDPTDKPYRHLNCGIVVMSYDSLARFSFSNEFDLAIFDEAHYLKSPGAKRTQRLYGQGKGVVLQADKVILMSGTPAPNGPQELWTHLNALWPERIQIKSRHGTQRPMTEQEWTARVCIMKFNKWGAQIVGTRNVPFIRNVLKPIMIRRTKRQVLPELPPVIARDVPLDLDMKKVWARLTPETRRLHIKLATKFRTNGFDPAKLFRTPSDPDTGTLASLRRQLVEAKLRSAVEWAAPRLDNDPCAKFVFFGWHVGALQRLHALMAQYNPVILTGATSDPERKHAVTRFQDDPLCRVFIGQLKACGEAITLTAGTECVFLECAWTPGVNAQAISRLHRMGQKGSVLATFLFCPGTIDETVMRVFRRKAGDIKQFV